MADLQTVWAPRRRAVITAVGMYVPDYVLTNAELATMVDTNDEWITSRTGIKERRILKDPTKATGFMGVNAARQALDKRGLAAAEVEVVLCATTTPDYVFPATANYISKEIGATNAFGYDVSAACSAFLFTLATGVQMIESGRVSKVLIVGADKMSSIVDYTDRTTCIIFGDAAGAVLLEAEENSSYGVGDYILRSDGAGFPYLYQKAGGSINPPSHATVDGRQHFVYQEGAVVFKFAVSKMADTAAELLERHGLAEPDVAWLVPHQANRRIIEATANRVGMPLDRVMLNIDRYGNTTNATIPLCLAEYENKLKRGDTLLLAAFGGGFTWGSMLVRWAYGG